MPIDYAILERSGAFPEVTREDIGKQTNHGKDVVLERGDIHFFALSESSWSTPRARIVSTPVWEPSSSAIYFTVGWAVSTYYDRPQHIQQMVQAAMAQDYSWEKSAAEYVAMYERALAVRG